MAFLASSYCTPLAATGAAACTRLPATAVRSPQLTGSGVASGFRQVAVAAVLPVGASARAAVSSARTRCAAGDHYQQPWTSELLTMDTFTALADELRCWLNNTPKCKEDFKKMEITAGKCIDLFPRLVHDSRFVPKDILKEITDIKESKFMKLHDQSSGEDPKADTSDIEVAINGIERMKEIFFKGGPGLMGSTRP